MEKLQQFYLSLSTTPSLMAQFNNGNSTDSLRQTRLQMLASAGVDSAIAEKVVGLNQDELRAFFADEVGNSDASWKSFTASSPNSTNSTNTTNKISSLGLRRVN